jgi:hypothetical protein
MVLFYLTNAFLDVSFGVIWWVSTKSVSLLYNSAVYALSNEPEPESEPESEPDKISKDYVSLTKCEIKELIELKHDIKNLLVHSK